jgi:protein-disulfide isomerase
MAKKPKGFVEKLLPILLGGAILMAFIIGILWEKVSSLEKGGAKTAATAATQETTPQAQQPQQVAVSLDQIKGLFSQDVIKFGDANKKVLFTIIEDPSCPYCHIASGLDPELNTQAGDRFKLVSDGGTYVAPVPEMEKLVDQGKAGLVYIYTPGHGNGEMGMKALYCAYDQGKFWQAHDLLYSNDGYNLLNNTVQNDKTKSQQLADFLKSVVNANDLKSCIDSGKYDNRLTSDTQLATSLGVQGTPGFFINTTNFAGAYSWKDMESAVNTALK